MTPALSPMIEAGTGLVGVGTSLGGVGAHIVGVCAQGAKSPFDLVTVGLGCA